MHNRSMVFSVSVMMLFLSACALAQTEGEMGPAPVGFAGQLRGRVVSVEAGGKGFGLQVESTQPDQKRNKLENAESLVGQTLTVGPSGHAGRLSQEQRIALINVGDRVWVNGAWGQKQNRLMISGMYPLDRAEDQGAVLLLGDSIFDWWADHEKVFAGVKVRNRSAAGDGTWGVLARLDEAAKNLKPRAVVLMIGTNNLLSVNPQRTVGDIEKIITRLREGNASLPVVLCLIMPQDAGRVPPEKVKETNERLRKLAEKESGVTIADTFTPFAVEDGSFDKALFLDRVHPNRAGYEKLGQVLQPLVMQVLGETAGDGAAK